MIHTTAPPTPALETQTVHKLTHDFLLLDDDELSSESDSDSEGEGDEEGGRRRRNSSVDQVGGALRQTNR